MKRQTLGLTIGALIYSTCLLTRVNADVTSSWTYQGELAKAGSVYTGSADFLFSLWTAETAGSQLGHTLVVTNVPVATGRFGVDLDFGYDPFASGNAVWLKIAVRTPAGAGTYTSLDNRQPITPAPYAIHTRGINVDANLNVGIGTTTPGFDLEVYRSHRSFPSVGPDWTTFGLRHVNTALSGDSTESWLSLQSSQDFHDFLWKDLTTLRFGTTTNQDGSGFDPKLVVSPGGFIGINTESPSTFLQVNSGTSAFAVDSAGRIGVGTTAPQFSLDLRAANGAIRFPNGTVQNTAPFTDTGFRSAAGGVPGVNATGWVTTPASVTIAQKGQKVFVLAHQELQINTQAKGLKLHPAYSRAVSGTIPTLVGLGMELSFDEQDLTSYFGRPWLKCPVTVSAIIESLDPGTYYVGMAGHQDADPGLGYGAGAGYVTAFVF